MRIHLSLHLSIADPIIWHGLEMVLYHAWCVPKEREMLSIAYQRSLYAAFSGNALVMLEHFEEFRALDRA